MLHVLFTVGDTEYVLPYASVVQMESFTGATRVPGTAPFVAGVMQIRGRVVPVVDLRRRFGLDPAPRTLDSRVVVVRQADREVALLADRAREVVDIAPDRFESPPEVVAARAAGFVSRVAQADRRLVMQLDLEKVLGADPLSPEETNHATEP